MQSSIGMIKREGKQTASIVNKERKSGDSKEPRENIVAAP